MEDCLIIGAGCAGLSLAVELLERTASARRITLIEPRETYAADRHWCQWSTTTTRWNALSDHRWTRWTVDSGRASVTRHARGLSYLHIPSDRFYESALEMLRPSKRVSLQLGTRVEAVLDRGDHVAVETDRGRVEGRIAFDSRPDPGLSRGAPKDPKDIRLLQHFLGLEVESERPVFDPDRATLMDFRVRQDLGIHFVYVLPFSPTRALVESTFFTRAVCGREVYENAIQDYLRSTLQLSSWRVVRQEQGVLPMSTESMGLRPSPRVYRIGVAGGAAKPSTGYAFAGIQRQAMVLAEGLARQEFPDAHPPRGLRETAMDRMFLSFLDRYPARAPEMFFELFRNTDPHALARFLSDLGSPLDAARVMRAAASMALITESARSWKTWMKPA